MSRCSYCGAEYANVSHHERRCPRHPGIAPLLRDFMREWAIDGDSLTSTEYRDMKTESLVELPDVRAISEAHGSWGAFVRSCGLRWEPQPGIRRGPEPCEMPGSQMADDTMYHDPSCLRCVPATRPVREWMPRAKAWVTVGEQLVWQVR